MIRVAVVDDQALIRDGLRTQLALAPDVALVGEASTGEQAHLLARRERPDVVLMDIRMPGTDGIEATRRIVSDPSTRPARVPILSTFDIDDYVYAALRAGASGFLLKDATPEELLQGIRVVAAGESLLAPPVTSRLIRDFARRPGPSARPEQTQALAALTDREREVLLLVAEGLSNAEIAERLVVSPTTAKTHVNRILSKLGRHDRVQLVVLAYESGLVVPGG